MMTTTDLSELSAVSVAASSDVLPLFAAASAEGCDAGAAELASDAGSFFALQATMPMQSTSTKSKATSFFILSSY